MPIYQFKTEDGSIVERFFSMRNAPDIGDRVEVEGQMATRILTLPHITDIEALMHVARITTRTALPL